jgi:biotin carboxyl carrier protein
MQYEFIINGKQHAISIEKDNPGTSAEFKASIDGKSVAFSYSKISPDSYVLLFGKENKKIYASSANGQLFVHLDGKVITLDKVLTDKKNIASDSGDFGAKDRIISPMPGRIVKILVKEGDRIVIKQPLAIVESMKMENEVKSPTNGTIKSIHFKAGDLVEAGKPIIMITPDETAEIKKSK